MSTTEKTVMLVTAGNKIYEYVVQNIETALDGYINDVITFKNGFAIDEDAWNLILSNMNPSTANSAMSYLVRTELINALCTRANDKIRKIITEYTSIYPDYGGVTNTGLSYTLKIGSAGMEITKYSGTASVVEIPSTIDGLPVTAISAKAFYGASVTTVYVPASITSIGDQAFSGCTKLKTIIFVGDAPSFGKDVFKNVTATVQYIASNSTWTSSTVGGNYGGTLTWRGDCSNGHSPTVTPAVSPDCTNTGLTEGSHCLACGTVLKAQDVIAAVPGKHNIVDNICTGCGKYGTCGDDLLWEIDDAGTLTIEGSDTMFDYAIQMTPWTVKTEIAELIKKVIFKADNLTITGELFLGCKNLKTIIFDCDAPVFSAYGLKAFDGVTATAYYYSDNATWTETKRQNYGGTITWVGDCSRGHAVVLDTAKQATCINTGLTEGSHCSACGTVFVAQQETPINLNNHTEVVDKAVAATCNTTGLTEGKHCSACGDIIVKQEIIPADASKHVIEKDICTVCKRAGHLNYDYYNPDVEPTLFWSLNDAGTLTISGTGDMSSFYKYAPAPWSTEDIRYLINKIEIRATDYYLYGNLFGFTYPEDWENLTEITFYGDAPEYFEDNVVNLMSGPACNVYYPGDNATWTADMLKPCDGLNWIPY